MPTYLITSPDGKKYKVTGPGTKEEALAQVQAQVAAQAQPTAADQFAKEASGITQSFDQPKAETAPYAVQDAKQRYLQQMDGFKGGRGEALTQGSQAGLLGGYDDELAAAMLAPIDAGIDMAKGQGFDMGRAYTRKQKMLDLQKAQRREAYPGSSIAGEVAGGLALGGTVRAAPAVGAALPGAGAVPTLAGRIPGVLAAPLEGAAYGAAYGSGEANPGERLRGAAEGAATGATLGTLLHGAGAGVSKIFSKAPVAPAASSADELAAAGSALYTKMRESGVVIKPEKIAHLKANIGLALGATNRNLAPKAFGLAKLAGQTLGENPGIGELHNFAKSINRVLRTRLEGEDAHYVGLLKTQVEKLIDGMTAADITGGGPEAFKMWKEADKLWGRQKKTDIIEKILDAADVRTGQYTQSGLANTISKEMRTLYKSIQRGRTKGFTKDEIALVRQMAKGGSNSRIINLLAKFAPRGVVSAVGGFALGGPALTLGGHLAGQAADRGALKAANTLRDATARGYVSKFPQLPNYGMPFIPGATAPTTEQRRAIKSLIPGG